MLVECGIFTPVADSSNLIQLSGVPMCDLDVRSVYPAESGAKPEPWTTSQLKDRGLSDIRFVRHRMLYARAALNSREEVRFGLNPIHALNRYRNVEDDNETQHIMKYIFPCQFGLHNVLTSDVDRQDTSEQLKDYTLREQEITRQRNRFLHQRLVAGKNMNVSQSVPKRIRGKAQELVQRLRKRHARCSYFAMLNYYCPAMPSPGPNDSISKATNTSQVSAFCRAVITKVFPKAFWAAGETGRHNSNILSRNIDLFVRIRRYESMSLHDVLQGMRLEHIEWLAPVNARLDDRLSASDFKKRKELMAEILYYLFDSFLIPLLRAHFHITESNQQRNQLFYFRHDVWKALSEPALATLKQNMFEECSMGSVKEMMAKRSLGVSKVRLLPKQHGMRPIINLRRRVQMLQNGRFTLGKSINSLMTPAFSVLNYEKTVNPAILGSALFSVDDLFPRLQEYRQSLHQQGLQDQPLYFAKVDVQSCFDTIPQRELMRLAKRVISANTYHTTRYSRAKLAGGNDKHLPGFGAKPSWKFLTKTTAGRRAFDFQQEVENDTDEGRTRSVYINGIAQKRENRHALISLLEEHVESNLIKIGKRYYRQKEGIPQGSIVSSLLCSYFYAELERDILGFVDDGKSLLLRLIDDFLVISTEKDIAERFLQTMHAGVPRFGVTVKPEKSRANFDVEIDGVKIEITDAAFPYCGNAIDTRTLNITKDRERRRKTSEYAKEALKYTTNTL